MDLTKSIEPRSDQLNAEDMLTGPRTFTITDVRAGTEEQPVRVFLAEGPEGRPWIPAKTMRRLMVLAWGAESDAYIGKRVTLYRDPTIRFGPDTPGGIRISHMSGIGRKPLVAQLTEKRGKRVPYKVEPLSEDAPDAKAPGPLDQLVWAMNAAKIPQEERLLYCCGVIGRDVDDPRTMTPDEMGKVVEALKQRTPAPHMGSVPVGPVLHTATGQPVEPSEEEQEAAFLAEQERTNRG